MSLPRRWGWSLATSVLLVASSLALPARATPAQTDPTPTGEARSAAYALRLAPAIGGTALTMTFGGAGALLQNAAGTGIAAGADLGLLATIFQSGVCGFAFPFDVFPPSVLVTNTKGSASRRQDIVPAGGLAAVGAQEVAVTTDPSVDADVRLQAFDLMGGLQLQGLRATTHAANLDGATPSGEAVVTTDVVIPGLIELRGLRWEVHQEGAGAPGTGSFSLASGTMLGVPLPVTDLTVVAELANTLLAPLGLRMVLPTLERIEGATPIVRMTPLVVGFVGSPVVNTVLEPLLSVTRTLKEQLVEAISSSCFSSYGGLIADLAVGLVIGTGHLDLLVGGVEVSTNDDTFEDPFGSDPVPAPDAADVLPPRGALGGVPAPIEVGAAPAGAPAPSGGLLATVCESAHPKGDDSCSDGAAVAAGVVALAGVLLAAVGDLVLRRRRPTRAES